MTSQDPSRLDRIEDGLERLVRIQAVFYESLQEQSRLNAERYAQQEQRIDEQEERTKQHELRIQRLDDILASLAASEERQNRILDYLMRRDGERNP